MGLAANVEVLQHLPRVLGNQRLVNELAFAAQEMMGGEAPGSRLVSRVSPSRRACLTWLRFPVRAWWWGRAPKSTCSTPTTVL